VQLVSISRYHKTNHKLMYNSDKSKEAAFLV